MLIGWHVSQFNGTVSYYTCTPFSTILCSIALLAIVHRWQEYKTRCSLYTMTICLHLAASVLIKPFAIGWGVLFLFMKSLIAARDEWMLPLIWYVTRVQVTTVALQLPIWLDARLMNMIIVLFCLSAWFCFCGFRLVTLETVEWVFEFSNWVF